MSNPSEQEVAWDVGSMVVNSDGAGGLRLNVHGVTPDGEPGPDVALVGTPDQGRALAAALVAACDDTQAP